MLFQIISFLLDVAAGLLGGACLLRLYMQYQRIPFGNPVGRFVFALTDWIVLPLRKVLPAPELGPVEPRRGLPDRAGAVRPAVAAVGRAYRLIVPLLALFGWCGW
jgi:hypothetical protein